MKNTKSEIEALFDRIQTLIGDSDNEVGAKMAMSRAVQEAEETVSELFESGEED